MAIWDTVHYTYSNTTLAILGACRACWGERTSCVFTRGRAAASGYSSPLVCLSVGLIVCHEYLYSPGYHSAANAAYIAFTQQYLALNSGRFLR